MSELDPLFDSEEINKKKAVARKRLKEREQSDLRKVLFSAEGRRFVWRVLGEAKVFHGCFSLNGLEMAKNEGKRDLGLFVLNDLLKSHPDAFAQMQREAASDKFLQENEQAVADKENQNG